MLELVEKPKNRAPIMTLCGEAGVGKTSLACSFPNAIVIRAEDGLQAIPEANRPDAFPVVKSVDSLWKQMKALSTEKHNYKTLVIDSITALEALFTAHVIASDPKKPSSINQALGGYGAGLAAVAGLHAQVRRGAGVLNEAGMAVVFVAHCDTETIELPDCEPYMRYQLRLGKRSVRPYVDDVDLVGFLKLETFTSESKKAISDGTRVLVCHAVASNVSKNRYGITEPLNVPIGTNPLLKILGDK